MRTRGDGPEVGAGIRPLPLATGDLSARDAGELAELMAQIQEDVGFAGTEYRQRYMRRRLGVRMRKRGLERYADYAALLASEPEEYERLLRTITINFSRFYRNPDVWSAIAEVVVPALLERRSPLRLWVAAAACGEEAYTLAMLLLERARQRGLESRARRIRIVATDIDERALERAEAASYPDRSLVELPEGWRERWFEGGPPWRVRPEVRSLVEFRRLDLISEAYPSQQDLILCRNVLIYFDRPLQDRILAELEAALAPGGFLVLGKVESAFALTRGRLETVQGRQRIYRAR